MARFIIRHPAREQLAIHGVLAHVESAERQRILAVPYGQFKKEVKMLEKEVDLAKFPRKKKSIVTTSRYNPNKPKPIKEHDHEAEPDTDE